jgi:hypothetical protein
MLRAEIPEILEKQAQEAFVQTLHVQTLQATCYTECWALGSR